MMMMGWRGSLLLLLLLSFSCGGIASSSSSSSSASSREEDESAISVFNAVTDIVQSISTTRNWNLDHVQILNIDLENVRFTKATVYELDIQIGDQILPAKFIDEVANWQRLGDLDVGPRDQHPQEKVTKALWGSKALQSVLAPFQLNGPVDLSFESSGALQDSSQEKEDIADFKNVNLAMGSSVEVEGAREVSLSHPVELSLPINRSSPIRSLATSILSLAVHTRSHASENEDVAARLSLHITGPALVATITGLDSPLHQAEDLDSGFVKLLYKGESEYIGEKSHPPLLDFSKTFDKASIWPFPFLNSSDPRLSVLEKMLKAYLGSSSFRERSFTIRHAKVAALTFVLFEFEIERKLNKEDFEPELWPEWRTRPKVKRYRFQVLAKVQDNTLVPITVQPLKPYKNVETYTWREVTSNVSYTSFSSYLVPSSPMTLDIY